MAAKASVIAGLKCAPEMCPNTVTSTMMPAGGTREAARGDSCPVDSKAGVAQQRKTRRKVPKTSATIWGWRYGVGGDRGIEGLSGSNEMK